MIRNAIDHGIEPPSERISARKPVVGTLRVCARQSGNQILIEITDDGRGIDGDKLARKAVAAGVVTAEQAERLVPAERLELIFAAGLSTAQAVTSISGRGVGMDVVRANVERIGGVVEVDSKPGQGVRLTLRVPLTLTIIPALTISVAGQTYAVPRSAIDEIVRVRSNAVAVEAIGGAYVVAIRDKRHPLVPLCDVLGVAAHAILADQSIIVLKPAGGEVYALAVDLVHDHEELVIKPAAPLIMASGLYAGTTLADDGSPILLLDPSGIAAAAGVTCEAAERERSAAPRGNVQDEGRATALLFRMLDGTKRVIPLAVVERIEDVAAEAMRFSAGRLRVAIGDEILPLLGCERPAEGGKMRVLRLTDGVTHLAYGFADVIDLVPLSGEVQLAQSPGEVAGVMLMGGEQVELIDSYWLFASVAAAWQGAAETKPVCALATDDPWMNAILRPMVEGAGYAVVSLAEAGSADIVIAGCEGDVLPASSGGQVLRLRNSADAGETAADSIYRYDRPALLSALSRHAARGRR
jgi:two-component system chemotaxis sensor kinase CheA